MKPSFFTVFVILITANVLICESFIFDENVNVEKAVKFYNSIPGLWWTAGKNGLEENIKISHIKTKLGSMTKQKKAKSQQSSHRDQIEIDDLPKNYDCRTAYPECTTIPSIKDQSNCKSCWAVAVASTFSDRLCIKSNGKFNFNMSAEQLMSCDETSNGCNGGYIGTAWEYISDNGLVTGGDYGSKEGCLPYSIPPNRKFITPPAKTPQCQAVNCLKFYTSKNGTFEMSSECLIREEIYKNGPVSTEFTIYLSFHFYKEGIYQPCFIDLRMERHSVRVIGWGEEKGRKYWLVANSWGTNWGENGTFRIRRGTDECGFESHAIAGLPIVENAH